MDDLRLKIAEYDAVDPLGVLDINLMGLGYALTPQRVTLIRRIDPRPFPFFSVDAVIDGVVVGHIGVYRLPMMTIDGPEDVGGLCAVCTHPAYNKRGIASRLIEAAHERMRSAGLRFSTLGTTRHRAAHHLYIQHGYVDVAFAASAFARQAVAAQGNTHLDMERASPEQWHLTDTLFRDAAADCTGFSRRHEGHIAAMIQTGEIAPDSLWLVWQGGKLVGYLVAQRHDEIVWVRDFLLRENTDVVSVMGTLIHKLNAAYIQVHTKRQANVDALHQAGYRIAQPNWSTFMMKPLVSGVTIDDARRLFAIGTDRFLISPLDTT